MKNFSSKITKEFEILILSISELFSSLFTDFLNIIIRSNKKYHWIVGGFLYMLANSVIPLYYIFTDNFDGLKKEGSVDYESGDFVTYLNSFKLSVYIFLIISIIFIFIELRKLRGPVIEWINRKKRLEQLDNLLDKYTLPEKKENHSE